MENPCNCGECYAGSRGCQSWERLSRVVSVATVAKRGFLMTASICEMRTGVGKICTPEGEIKQIIDRKLFVCKIDSSMTGIDGVGW